MKEGMTKDEALSIKLCNCGRSWCDFFGAGVGEYGTSYSRKEIEEMLAEMEKDHEQILKHLRKLLKAPNQPH